MMPDTTLPATLASGLVSTLAQWGDPQSVARLPKPSLLQHLLLEHPWPLVGALLAGAVVALGVLNARGKAKAGVFTALGLATLAGGVYALAAGVRTDREAILQTVRDLVAATAEVRLDALRPLLADDVRLDTSTLGAGSSARGRDELLSQVRRSLQDQYPLAEHSITALDAAVDGPGVGRGLARVRVTPRAGASHLFAWVRVDLRRQGPADWRATVIEPLAVWFPGQDLRPN